MNDPGVILITHFDDLFEWASVKGQRLRVA